MFIEPFAEEDHYVNNPHIDYDVIQSDYAYLKQSQPDLPWENQPDTRVMGASLEKFHRALANYLAEGRLDGDKIRALITEFRAALS